jgi:hypothetical protein
MTSVVTLALDIDSEDFEKAEHLRKKTEKKTSPFKVQGSQPRSTMELLKILSDPSSPLHVSDSGDLCLEASSGEDLSTINVESFDDSSKAMDMSVEQKMLFATLECDCKELEDTVNQLECRQVTDKEEITKLRAELSLSQSQAETVKCENQAIVRERDQLERALIQTKLELAQTKTDMDSWQGSAEHYAKEIQEIRVQFAKQKLKAPRSKWKLSF